MTLVLSWVAKFQRESSPPIKENIQTPRYLFCQ